MIGSEEGCLPDWDKFLPDKVIELCRDGEEGKDYVGNVKSVLVSMTLLSDEGIRFPSNRPV